MAKEKVEKTYVAIQSTINIRVTVGLQATDVTKKESDLPDRLRVNPTWPKAGVMILKGLGYYPNCIKDWHTVKALAEKGIMSIVGETDTIGSLGTSGIAEKTGSEVSKEAKDIAKALADSNAKLSESPLEAASKE